MFFLAAPICILLLMFGPRLSTSVPDVRMVTLHMLVSKGMFSFKGHTMLGPPSGGPLCKAKPSVAIPTGGVLSAQ